MTYENLNISLDLLTDNDLNVFSRLEGDSKENLVASIKNQGILTPLIVREKGQKYEILSGHNRRDCAKEAGLKTVPCIVRYDVDDVTASILVAESNRQREEVTDLEWGRAYRNTLEALKRQREKDNLNRDSYTKKQESHYGTLKKLDEIVAEEYGLGRNTIRRKIRLTYLTKELYALYERDKSKKGDTLNQKLAIAISYFSKEIQNMIAIAIIDKKIINEGIVNEIKELVSMERIVTKDEIDVIFDYYVEARDKEKNEKKSRVCKYSIPDKYFPINITSNKSRREYLLKLLQEASKMKKR